MSHKKALILLECSGLLKGIPIMGHTTPYHNGQHEHVKKPNNQVLLHCSLCFENTALKD